jgi:hypothetical protein
VIVPPVAVQVTDGSTALLTVAEKTCVPDGARLTEVGEIAIVTSFRLGVSLFEPPQPRTKKAANKTTHHRTFRFIFLSIASFSDTRTSESRHGFRDVSFYRGTMRML